MQVKRKRVAKNDNKNATALMILMMPGNSP